MKRTKHTNTAMNFQRCFNILIILALLMSGAITDVKPVSAANAGTALQFNGSSQYVTFGDTSMVRGVLTGSPTWNSAANSKFGASSLTFDGSRQYVTFGAAPELGSAVFTIETWFYRTATGVGTDTSGAGGGGLQGAIPLVTKGRGEADYSNVDMNYFLGISTTSKLAADFEDMTAVSPNPNNHAIIGTTTLANNTWYHAAATFDGATFKLYLNGVLEASTATTATPRWDSIQHAGLGTGLTSTGAAGGFFAGRLDEARIWNVARTQAQIQASMNSEILSPTSGLVGRWGMNDASGTTASNLNRLGVTSFTLEAWVKRAAGGATMTTGTNGFDGTGNRPDGAYPVLAKGMGEGETPANVNTNYFLGITQNGFVGADFEDTAGGGNHPAWGTTAISLDQWHHIAATYNGACWAFFVDGNVDPLNSYAVQCANATPESTSYQRAALSAGINSTGGLGTGFFSGVIDEARIWNRPLSQAEIQANKFSQLLTGDGLIARWGLDEGSGTTINSSVGSFSGILTNAPAWVTGFPIPDSTPPDVPTGLAASPFSSHVSLTWTAPADADLAGYNVYRSTISPVALTSPVNGGTLVTGTSYVDSGLTNGTPYFYVVTAVDTSANQSTASNEVNATPLASLGSGLSFDGVNDYVTFGIASGLDVTNFTLETWFNWTGGGATANTGSGGVTAIPLVAKGLHESDGSNVDANYFLGITSGGNLAADFEEYGGGQNYPVTGVKTVSTNTWHHAAVTYDGQTWKLYLDGVLDVSSTLAAPHAPRYDSIQHAGIGTAMNSTGVPEGYFAGKIDEVRIWSRALSLSEIQNNINLGLTSGTGLVARWGMNEAAGTTIASSVGTFPGMLTNGPTWVTGAPFNLQFNNAPAAPTPVAPSNGATDVSTSPTLTVSVTDPEADPMSVSFYGRPKNSVGPDFTLVALPDTQNYTASLNGGSPAIFNSQTQWIANNRAAENIVFVSHEGDVTNSGDSDPAQWTAATTALNYLENPVTTGLPQGIPYGITIGNHDQTGGTAEFNDHFGSTHFSGKSYYGGHYNTTNNNNYELFSASGMDFIFINLEYSPTAEAISWANGLLQTYSTRRAIVACHEMIGTGNPASFSGSGSAIYNGLRGNPNLFLILAGHTPGVGQRTDTYNGNTVYTLMADYQNETSGGNGWLRLMKFMPSLNQIQVKTFSPYPADQWKTAADQQFNLTYAMNGSGSYTLVGTATNVASGTNTSITWPGLAGNTEYEWYAVSSDGNKSSAASAAWSFTTIAAGNQPPVITEGASTDVNMSEDGSPTPFNLTLHATDANVGDTLTWSIVTPASHGTATASGTGASVAVGYTPAADYTGSDSFVVQVSDGNGGTVTITVNVTITPVNNPPVVTNPDSQSSAEGAVISLQIVASDVDLPAQTLTYSATNLPMGLSVNSATGLISGTIAYNAATTTPYNVTVTVSDGAASTPVSFTWSVSQAASGLCGNDANLVGCWPMEEGSGGVVIDATAFGNDGTTTGIPTWVTGHIGKALSLSGTGQYAVVPNSASLDITSTITLAAWIKPTKTSAYTQYIIKKVIGTTTSSGYELSLSSGGKVFVRFNGGTTLTTRVDSNYLYPTDGNTWVHVAATYDGSNIKVYINGTLDNSKTVSFAIGSNSTNLGIGAQPDGVYPFQGMIDDARVYNRALSLEEVQVLAGLAPTCYTLTLSHTGNGSDPTASPANSTDCPAGQYIAGASISLSGATPDLGWQIGSWTGTTNDSSTASTNSLTMPASVHTASVSYTQLSALISGNAGIGLASLAYTGGSTTANGGGVYSFTVPYGWSGTVTPSLTGYTFSPASRTYTSVTADQTAQDFTATPVIAPPTGLTCTNLNPKPATTTTGEKPQSKVWSYGGNWYAVFPTSASGASSAGTWLWQLQGTTWTEMLKLSGRTDTKADIKVAGNLAHILLYADANTQFITAEFTGSAYQLWTSNPSLVNISLPNSEIATIDRDSTGEMWLATRNNNNTGEIIVYHSASPYSTWNGPIVLATGVAANDDIAVVTALPNGTIGVLWANETTKYFGFRVHVDGADPSVWSADERPASQSAHNEIGLGMADDHLHVAVASDSTLYAAVKTSYDTAGYPKIAFLVRRPNGVWDDLYGIDEAGTRPIILLDEVHGHLTLIYTSSEGNNPIIYRQSSTQSINFSSRATLRAEAYNDVSSIKANYNSEFVVIYSNGSEVAGQKCAANAPSGADLAITKTDGRGTVRPGDTLTFTIQATNNGPQAVTGAVLADSLPAILTNAAWTCVGAAGGVCSSSGTGNINDTVNLPVNASVTYTIIATLDLGARGSMTNSATITPPGGITDPILSNNSATDTDTIVTGAAACGSDASLVGCWQMEENGGAVLVDGSSFNNDASLSGSPLWVTGKVGAYALALNGTNQNGFVPNNASLNLNTLTLAAWIKPGQIATQDLLKKAINGIVDGYELSLATTKGDASSQRVFFRINQASNGDTYRINATTMYPIDGTWMHVAATFDGTTMRLYINGTLESDLLLPAGTTITTNSLPLSIGAQSDNQRWFKGTVDEARVYNRALSEAEIRTLAGLSPTYTLTVTKTGTGTGVVTSNPIGIECDATCSADFAADTLVALTAVPDTGSAFTGWGGACSGTGVCNVTMHAARSVTANFDPASPISLHPGWNLVSLPLQPVNPAIEQVLASITGSYDTVFGWDAASQAWRMFDNNPITPETLTELDEKVGFWIHMTSGASLVVTGTVPTPPGASLVLGVWNLVGFQEAAPRPVASAVPDSVSLIFGFNAADLSDPWKMFDRSAPAWVNDLTELTPGWGYWVYGTASDSWPKP